MTSFRLLVLGGFGMVQKLLNLNQNKQTKGGHRSAKVSRVDTHAKLKKMATRDVVTALATKDIRKKATRGENTLIAKAMVEGHTGLDLLKTTEQALAKVRQKSDRNKQRGYKQNMQRK